MKLDLFKRQWLDIVFEGRNKSYGAYEMRNSNTKTSVRALLIGAFVFSLAIGAPLIAKLIPDSSDDDENRDIKITAVKLPPKEQPKENIPPPPPPPPKVDQVKFVKPVVAKADEVTEEPPKIEEIKDKKIGAETIKGDPDAELTVEPVGSGPSDVVAEDNTIYNSAGIEVKADYPGGVENFRNLVKKNYMLPDEAAEAGVSGKVFVTFVVEKDGSISDIRIIRDIGYGTGKEATRAIKSIKVKWNAGEQNGRKVRMLFSMPISIVSGE